MTQAERDIRRKLRIFKYGEEYALVFGHATKPIRGGKYIALFLMNDLIGSLN